MVFINFFFLSFWYPTVELGLFPFTWTVDPRKVHIVGPFPIHVDGCSFTEEFFVFLKRFDFFHVMRRN